MSSFTVPTELCQAQFNYVGGQNPLPCGFPALDASNVVVQYTSGNPPVTQTLVAGLHYTVALDAVTGFVTVTPTAQMPAAPGTVTVTRNTPAVQPDQYTNQESFVADAITTDFDRAQMGIAECKRRLTALEGNQPMNPFVFVTAARTQRAINSNADLPVRTSDQILNVNVAAPLNIPIPGSVTRAGAPLTVKMKQGSQPATLIAQLSGDAHNDPDTFDGLSQIGLVATQSVTLVPYNDTVNVGYAIE